VFFSIFSISANICGYCRDNDWPRWENNDFDGKWLFVLLLPVFLLCGFCDPESESQDFFTPY